VRDQPVEQALPIPFGGGFGVVVVGSLWQVTHYNRYLKGIKVKIYVLLQLRFVKSLFLRLIRRLHPNTAVLLHQRCWNSRGISPRSIVIADEDDRLSLTGADSRGMI
jgi:hypothetical protein